VDAEPVWSDSTVILDLLMDVHAGVFRLLGYFSGCSIISTRTMAKKKIPKRTPEERAHSLQVRERALRHLEELKRRDIERAAKRSASS
jgi:hypothetical protein